MSYFYKGVRPAVNVGISVSRVGSAAQIKAMKQVAGSVKLELAQFRELESFSQFGSDLDPATKAQIDHGKRLVEILKQAQYHPFPVEEQIVSIYVGTKKYLNDVPLQKVKEFEDKMLTEIRLNKKDILESIKNEQRITEETEQKLKAFLENFVKEFCYILSSRGLTTGSSLFYFLWTPWSSHGVTMEKPKNYMSNLKQLRTRIKSVKSTQKITKAMQLVSASKMAKIKKSNSNSNFYIEAISKMMSDILSIDMYELSIEEQKFFNTIPNKANLLIVMTSQRGLCGTFNYSIIKQVKNDIKELENKGEQIKLVIIGKKGYEALKGNMQIILIVILSYPKFMMKI